MKVVVREYGTRPSIATPARLNAPQGAKALADILADKDFADLCVLTIDWEGDGFTSVLSILTVKWFIEYGGQRLEHVWPIDLEDAFGLGNMDRGILLQIAHDLEEHFEEMTESRRKRESN